MDPYSTTHRQLPHDGADLVGTTGGEAHSGPTNLESRSKLGASRSTQASVSAALAAMNAGLQSVGSLPVRFPGEDGGHSLAEVAQRDLDAALQLLADRAQYITGAGGAAIALRRDGMNDLLCRASAGSNAPELGALLSTEFGLSGESVRTRRALRCDDAERDARVNREVCRELGIASVVVMPVVDDDQVLGVFELFSGKANAFGERDLSALQRLSEMVETAVKLARAAESVTQYRAPEDGMQQPLVTEQGATPVSAESMEVPVEVEDTKAEVAQPESQAAVPTSLKKAEAAATPVTKVVVPVASALNAPPAVPASMVAPVAEQISPAKTISVPKPLFWSVALSASGEAEKAAEAERHLEDLNHVPPMLRNLRKCQACGFPVSTGRTLCVECEEKKWRGHLKPQTAVTIPVPETGDESAQNIASAKALEKEEDGKPSDVETSDVKPGHVQSAVVPKVDAANGVAAPDPSSTVAAAAVDPPSASEPLAPENFPASDFAFSAGMEPSQSWLAANKYIVGAIVVAVAAIAAFVFLR
jgi:hypothetical protein